MAGEFLENVPKWLWYDFFGGRWKDIRGRLQRRFRWFGSRLRQAARTGRIDSDGPDPEDFWDLSAFPPEMRKIIEAHFNAWRNYVPQRYPGRVTLFKASAQPLLRFREPDLGWGGYAGGGLEIVVIPGSHEGILHEPHVRLMAARLRECLDRAAGNGA